MQETPARTSPFTSTLSMPSARDETAALVPAMKVTWTAEKASVPSDEPHHAAKSSALERESPIRGRGAHRQEVLVAFCWQTRKLDEARLHALGVRRRNAAACSHPWSNRRHRWCRSCAGKGATGEAVRKRGKRGKQKQAARHL